MPDHGLRFAGSGRRVSHPAPNPPTTHTKRQVPGCDKAWNLHRMHSQEQAASHRVIGLATKLLVLLPSILDSGGRATCQVSSISQAAALPPSRTWTMDRGSGLPLSLSADAIRTLPRLD